MKRRCSSIGRILKSKSKNNIFSFVLGNKNDQKAVGVVTARTTPPSGILPFHTVISFIFRRWWWRYACHQCIQPHWKSWRKCWLLGYFQTSQKDVIKWTSFIRLASFKPILHHWPIVLWNSSLMDLCPGKKYQKDCESDADFPWNLHIADLCALHIWCFKVHFSYFANYLPMG